MHPAEEYADQEGSDDDGERFGGEDELNGLRERTIDAELAEH
jgi:hypothetical protein